MRVPRFNGLMAGESRRGAMGAFEYTRVTVCIRWGSTVATAYDEKDSVTIIPRMLGSKMLSVNLDTQTQRVLDADTQQCVFANENGQQQTAFSAAEFRAFHLKFKFCTAR